MNKSIFISALLLLFFNNAKSQYYPFPYMGWKQVSEYVEGDYLGNYESELFETLINNDTIINNNHYYVLENEFGNTFLRREEGKYIILNENASSEKIIIDFGLEVGDTFVTETHIILGGLSIDTLFVLHKEKILGPGQDSIFKMTLSKDPNFQLGGSIWIEGAGEWTGGFPNDVPATEMTGSRLLCTLNEFNQTIYSTELWECDCEKLFGTDKDRDGARNQYGEVRIITITGFDYGLNQKITLNPCDTLIINDEFRSFFEVWSNGEVIFPDSISTLNPDLYFYYNLTSHHEILVHSDNFTETHFTITFDACFLNNECLIYDCDDNNSNISPNHIEEPYNGLDDDCNPETPDDDLDQDGFVLAEDCDDNNPNVNPDQSEEPYNGLDDDCNSATFDDDLDQDGFVLAEDCNDNNSNINPDQIEEPYNGLDDDCNSATLDDDLDQDGFVLAEDCNDNNSNINPDQIEEPYNGLDDDCNSATFDDDLDQDGFILAEDCDDDNSNINPGAEEIPNNGIDEDCDGMDLISSTYEIANSTINIYPNPTSGIINIDVNGTLNFEANLYNLKGELIKSSSNASQLNVNSTSTGTYLLEIRDLKSGKYIVERIVIN